MQIHNTTLTDVFLMYKDNPSGQIEEADNTFISDFAPAFSFLNNIPVITASNKQRSQLFLNYMPLDGTETNSRILKRNLDLLRSWRVFIEVMRRTAEKAILKSEPSYYLGESLNSFVFDENFSKPIGNYKEKINENIGFFVK